MLLSKLKLFYLAVILSLIISCGKNQSRIIYVENSCHIDRIDGANKDSDLQYNVDSGSVISILGWAIDSKSRSLPKKITAVLISPGGEIFEVGSGALGGHRPDVAAAFSSPALENSGYRVEGKVTIPLQTYSIQLIADYGNKILICAPNKQLSIR